MSDKKVKYLPCVYDQWTESYEKQYHGGKPTNKPDVNLLPDDVYMYLKKAGVIGNSPTYIRKEDNGKTEEA